MCEYWSLHGHSSCVDLSSLSQNELYENTYLCELYSGRYRSKGSGQVWEYREGYKNLETDTGIQGGAATSNRG